jgi:hypothetical protein
MARTATSSLLLLTTFRKPRLVRKLRREGFKLPVVLRVPLGRITRAALEVSCLRGC